MSLMWYGLNDYFFYDTNSGWTMCEGGMESNHVRVWAGKPFIEAEKRTLRNSTSDSNENSVQESLRIPKSEEVVLFGKLFRPILYTPASMGFSIN